VTFGSGTISRDQTTASSSSRNRPEDRYGQP
jgi:hypothetical protein